MTESDFWTKFFQSHYFHRDRINQGTKDLFTECAKIDDQELKRDIQAGIDDPMVDITGFDDANLEEIYNSTSSKHDKPSGNIVHQNMIKRFNQHSIMVMKANNNQTAAPEQPQSNGSAMPSKTPASNNRSTIDSPKSKKVSPKTTFFVYLLNGSKPFIAYNFLKKHRYRHIYRARIIM